MATKHRERPTSALPVWREASPGEWVCDDSAEYDFYLKVGVGLNFDLPAFHRWLADMEPCGLRDRMLHARAQAKAARQPDEARPFLEAMYWGRTLDRREKFLLPLAQKGVSFSPGRRKNAVSDVTRYLRGERRPGESARALWERLKALGASDEQPIYFDGDEMIATRTSKSISFAAFEKRLIQRKRP